MTQQKTPPGIDPPKENAEEQASNLEGMFNWAGDEGFQILPELLSFKGDPEDYLAKAKLTSREIALMKRAYFEYQVRVNGTYDLDNLTKLIAVLSVTNDGYAREQVASIASGAIAAAKSVFKNASEGMGGFFGKMRG